MALPALVPAAVAAVGNFFGSLFSANKQDEINDKTMAFSREMYDKQRADNLSDWNMQNEYNHPSSVMDRYRQAGLNKNLVYGNGTTTAAGPLRGAEAPKWNPQSVAVNPGAALSTGLNAYMDIRQREAQTDNLRTQNTVLVQDQLLKKSSTDLNNLKAMREQLELNRGTDLYKYSLDMYKQQVRKMTLDADKAFYDSSSANYDSLFKGETWQSRADAANMSPDQLRSSINKTLADTKNAELQAEFKQLEIDMRKNGINSSDPIYFRVIGQLLSKYGITIK